MSFIRDWNVPATSTSACAHSDKWSRPQHGSAGCSLYIKYIPPSVKGGGGGNDNSAWGMTNLGMGNDLFCTLFGSLILLKLPPLVNSHISELEEPLT